MKMRYFLRGIQIKKETNGSATPLQFYDLNHKRVREIVAASYSMYVMPEIQPVKNKTGNKITIVNLS